MNLMRARKERPAMRKCSKTLLGLALAAFLPAQVGRHPGQQLLGGEGL